MRTSPGVCQRKARYATEADALAVAEKAPFPLRAYKCGLCRRYHLTGRTKGMKLPKFEIERRNSSPLGEGDHAQHGEGAQAGSA